MSNATSELRNPRVVGEQAARALRLELELGFSPIGGAHLWKLIADRGVDLAFHEFGGESGDGLYLWNGERGLIVLNRSDRKPTRLRFTAAHELGHHEIHRHTLPSVLLSDRHIALEQQADVEREANSFAAELLAPTAAIQKDTAHLTSESMMPIDVVKLMQTYGLSYKATLWKLFNSRVVTAVDRERLDAGGAGRVSQLEQGLGFREEELFAPPALSLPEDYVLGAVRVFREGAVGEHRFAELLRRSEDDAVELAAQIDPVADDIVDSAVADLLDS